MSDTARIAVEVGALALRLGRTDRSSLHPDGRTAESVTDHTVMLGLLACAWVPHLQPDLDVGLVAQLALAHDVVEAYAGDTSTLRLLSAADQADKAAREAASFARLAEQFGVHLPWLVELIAAYERLDTREARWVKAVDKAVVKTTHVLNGCAAPRRDGMTVEELLHRYQAQYREIFGPGGYGAEFTRLAEVYLQLVSMELAAYPVVDQPAARS